VVHRGGILRRIGFPMNEQLMLKYRPKRLSQIIGQEHVVTTLINGLTSGNMHQTYIFSGSYGCGKTSAARVLAASENCESIEKSKTYTLEPCGTCKMCREIFDGESSDIKEINAASQRSIEDVRNLIDFVATHPLHAKKKYVIVDECHSLTPSAAEALLKVLEEPPEDVRFVLATTDMQKMKLTVHSRCLPFRFSKVSWPQLLDHLKEISKKEGYDVDEAALKLAARLSKGSVRNSLNNLQLLKTFGGDKKITVEVAQKALGAVSDESFFSLVDAITAEPPNGADALKVIQHIFMQGQDVENLLNGLTEHLRNLMVLLTCESTAGLMALNDEEKQRYIHQYKRMSIHLVVEMIDKLYKVHRGILVNQSPQTLLEQFAIDSMISHTKIQRQLKTAVASK
jgi:DNA polymerase-3 subunit gamma/tau